MTFLDELGGLLTWFREFLRGSFFGLMWVVCAWCLAQAVGAVCLGLYGGFLGWFGLCFMI